MEVLALFTVQSSSGECAFNLSAVMRNGDEATAATAAVAAAAAATTATLTTTTKPVVPYMREFLVI